MKPTIRLALLLGALALVSSCGRTDDSNLMTPPNDSEGIAQVRVHATVVSFTRWHDTMQIDAGLTRDGAICRVLNPLTDDATTKWPPFQIYWAIRDTQSSVTLGTEIHDTFFPGDISRASEFAGVLGFAALDSQYARLLALEELTVSPDRTRVEAKIGSPFNVKLRLDAKAQGDGCSAATTYCKTSGDCTRDASFRPLVSILVKQNFLGYPTDVVYN